MALSAENRINLATLQRFDPYIIEILATSKQTTLYKFEEDNQEWQRTEIDGVCFIYKRSAPPINAFMILNRLGTENFVEPIRANLEFQRHEPFLLYKNLKFIYGIWFYDTSEFAKICHLLEKLVNEMKGCSESLADAELVASVEGNGVARDNSNILDMLSKAQSDYDKKSEPPSVTSLPNIAKEVIKPQAVKPEERGESIDINELFKTASLSYKEQSSKAPSSVQPTGHAFHRPPPTQAQTVAELEMESSLITPARLKNDRVTMSSSVPASPFIDSVSSQQMQTMHTPTKSSAADSLLSHTLMSPMAFSVPRAAPSSRPVAINPPQLVSEASLAFNTRTHTSTGSKQEAAAAANVPSHTCALTKEQLLQAFEHLLKTDENFLKSLHRAYVDSLNASLKD
ncbi:mRNA-decapping enzyme 1A-like [Watersipora subatra]|uniref:mRNA-decapping enzyme 1A-like n=1 Tax=Watersipora subatra TaxID=2589382 RepID=UPI00355BEA82